MLPSKGQALLFASVLSSLAAGMGALSPNHHPALAAADVRSMLIA